MTWLAYSHLGVARTVQLTTQPAVALAGIAFAVQPVGRLVDGSGVLSRATGVTVTASKASGTGTLSGTLTAVTVEGVFTFTDLKMDTATSVVTLQFAASGLTGAVSSAFNVTQPNTTIGCEVGTYTVTGTAQTLTRGPYMLRQDEVGSYAVTGTSATLTGPAGASIALVSTDWSTGTGSTDALLREDGKPYAWGSIGYSTKRLAVVSASGLGFPVGMANVIQCTCPVGTQNYTEVKKEFTEVAIGETIYYRVYLRHTIADSEGSKDFGSNHVVQSAPPGGSFGTDGGFGLKWGSNGDGTFPLRWTFEATGSTHHIGPGVNFQSSPGMLNKNTTYRIEWSFTRVASTVLEFHGRIYDEAVSTTVPLYDDNNMSGYDYEGGGHSGTIASGYGSDLVTTLNPWRVVVFGPNGANWTLSTVQYVYYGGFRATTGGGWIGAYNPGE